MFKYIDGLALNSGNSSSNTLELPQPCTVGVINGLARDCGNSIANALEQRSWIKPGYMKHFKPYHVYLYP